MRTTEREEVRRNALREAVNEFSAGYKEYMQETIDKVVAHMEKGNTIAKSVSYVAAEKGFLIDKMNEMLYNLLDKAVDLGYGKKIAQQNKAKILDIVLNKPWTADNENLQSRLSRFSLSVRKEIERTIFSTVSKLTEINDTVHRIENLAAQSNVDTKKLAIQCKKLRTLAGTASHGNSFIVQSLYSHTKTLERAVAGESKLSLDMALSNVRYTASEVWEYALPSSLELAFKGKALYRAERIARTEASRAWFESFIAKHQSNEKIFGYKWLLSPRHNIYDQCDVCANIDIGYGKGIYPKNYMPTIPRHPHCMCTLRVVYRSQVRNNAGLNVSKANEYFKSISSQQAQALFGVNGATAVQQGADWQGLLRGWNGFGQPDVRFDINDFD